MRPMNRKLWTVAAIVELLGIAVVSVGIGVELFLRAELGFVLITGGSLGVAAGGVIYAKFMHRP